jgi:hypothetical protein
VADPAPAWVRDGVIAGLVAAVPSAVPSTLHALLTRRRPLEATLAAGSILLPHERRIRRLLLAAVTVHVSLSVGWGLVLARLLLRRRPILGGAVAGLGIATLDLGIVGRRFACIRALPLLPQVADHLAYGAAAAAVLDRRRRRP